MEPPDPGLHELLDQMVASHGEAAVRRALQSSSLFSLMRDAADFHLDTATRARAYDGPTGTLVLEVPRKQNEPVEVSWLSEARLTMELEVIPKAQRRRGA